MDNLPQTAPLLRRDVPIPHNKPRRAVRLPVKLQTALKAIIWDGQDLQGAAQTAQLTTHAVRCALNKPHIISWMKAEREVFRAYVSAQNIHRAVEIRDAADNMPAVNAMKFIEEPSSEQTNKPASASPGITIRLVNVVANVDTPLTIEPDPPMTIPNSSDEPTGGEKP
jgi:hypothetical protein